MNNRAFKTEKIGLVISETMSDQTIGNQIQGSLQMLLGRSKRTKFCIVKDGFFLWYPYKQCNTDLIQRQGFDTKPQGILSLSGAIITWNPLKGEPTFLLKHTALEHSELIFKAEDMVTATLWVKALEEGKKANIENGKLGYKLVEQLSNEDQAKEQEYKEALLELEKKGAERKRDEAMRVKLMKKEGRLEKKVEELRETTEREKELLAQLNNSLPMDQSQEFLAEQDDVNTGPNDPGKFHNFLESLNKIERTITIANELVVGGRTEEKRQKGERLKVRIKSATATLREFVGEAKSSKVRSNKGSKRAPFEEVIF